jgi:hypothetical protein
MRNLSDELGARARRSGRMPGICGLCDEKRQAQKMRHNRPGLTLLADLVDRISD